MLAQLGWMSVNQLIFYHSALSIYRIRQGREPEYVYSLLGRNGRTGKIIASNTNLTLVKKSYCYRASAQWNIIPENIRTVRIIGQFKVQLRKWIFINVTQFVDAPD